MILSYQKKNTKHHQAVVLAESGQTLNILVMDKDDASDDEKLGRWDNKTFRQMSIFCSVCFLWVEK